MNRKTSWKETTVLKKSILLTIVLAILITLSASTFSLFNITDSVGTSTFSTKIYDVCRANTELVPDIIYEPDFIENSSPWIFMAFNSKTVTNYDTLIDVTLLLGYVLNYGESLDRLQVRLYAQDNPVPLSKVYFSGDTAKLFIPKHFLGDVGANTSKFLSLQFFYKDAAGNEQPISVNNPFVPGTTKFSAEVWGGNYLKNIEIYNWFYVKTHKQNNLGKIKGYLYVNGLYEDSLPKNGALDSPETLTIKYYKQTVSASAYMEISYVSPTYSYMHTQNFDPNAAYIPPDVIAIKNDVLFPDSTLDVDFLWFNGVLYSGELPDPVIDHEWFVYRNFQTTVDGFEISIEFTNSNSDFTIYVGNE